MKHKGFTLLELLVTISIIGILLAVGSVSFSTAQKRGRDSRRQADMTAIQKALEECYAVDSSYPASAASGTSLDCVGGEVTMSLVPEDPQPSGAYVYSVSATSDAYCLCATLENTGTGNADTTGTDGACSFLTDGDYFCVESLQ